MANKFRKSPPVCLFISIIKIIARRLKYSRDFTGKQVQMEDGSQYKIFRHIKYCKDNDINGSIFIARVKFARFSHNTNRILSIIPMLMITGFPGFREKIYEVNKETGYWQGMYQWENLDAKEDYKNSFVLKMMNKRAEKGTVEYFELDDVSLRKYIESNIVS